MAQSTLEILLQMRSNAKAVLDADAAAIRGITDAATKASGALTWEKDSAQAAEQMLAKMRTASDTLATAQLAQEDATKRVSAETEKLGTQTDTTERKQSALTSTIGRYLSAAAILGAIKSTGDYADELVNLSKQTGMGVIALQELDYAARQNGDSLPDLTRIIGVMADKIGSGDTSAKAAIEKLGLSFAAIRTMAPDQVFETLGAAVAKVIDPMEQARLKTDLFGRSGLGIPTITSDLAKLRQEAHDTGHVIDTEAVAAAADFDQGLENLTTHAKGLLVTGLEPLFGALSNVGGAFDALWTNLSNLTTESNESTGALQNFVKAVLALYGIKGAGIVVDELGMKIGALPDIAKSSFGAFNGALAPAATSMEELDAISQSLTNELKRSTPEVDAHAKALKTLGDNLSGAGVLKQAADYVTVVQNLGGVTTITRGKQDEINKSLGAAMEVYIALGQKAPKALQDIYAATMPLIPATMGWSQELLKSFRQIGFEEPAVTAGINNIIGGIGTLTTAADTAGVQAGLLTGAYQQFGLKTPAELKSVADAAVIHFGVLRDSGTATPEQIQIAFEQMRDKVKAANGEIPTQWETEIWPRISGVLGQLRGGFSDWFADVVRGTVSLKLGLEGLWNDIKDSFFNVLRQMMDYFTKTFLQGLLNAITGTGGGFSGAFANLFSGATGGGGGGTGGLARTALGLFGGGGGAGAATMFGAGGTFTGLVGQGAAAAGLLPSTSLGGSIAGGAGSAGSGLASAVAAGFAAGGAGIVGGMIGKQIFGGAGWKAGGFGAGTGALVGTMIMPGVGTAIGALAGLISGWVGKSKGEKVNDARDQFFAQFNPAMPTGHNLASGSSLLAAKLTEATGEAGGGSAFQQLITAGDQKSLEAAIARVNVLLAAQKTAQDAAGAAAVAAGQDSAAAATLEQDAIQAAKDAWDAKALTIKTTMVELANQQQQLTDSIKAEAPEKVMGVIESRTRAEIDALAAKSAQLEKDLAAGTAAATAALVTTTEATTAGMIVAGDTIGTAVIPKLEDMINRGINPAKDALGGVFDLFGQASQAAIDFGNTAYDAFMHAKDGADALALGQSPDGIQQIRVELEGAGRAAKPFEQSLVRAFEAAKDGVDGIFSGRPSRDERPARETVVAGSPIAINVTVGADAAGSKTTLSTNVREAFNDLVRRIDRNEDGLRTKLLRAMRLEPA